MTGSKWTRHIRQRSTATPQLHEVRDAAHDLTQQAERVPGKARIVFQTVADVALIGTAVVSGALAAVHLWKALTHSHHESNEGRNPEPAGAGRSPPHHRGHHSAVSDAGESEHPHHRDTAIGAKARGRHL
jgi:hypothetical protein